MDPTTGQQDGDGETPTDRQKREYVEAQEYLKSGVAQIMEHFDSITIVATRYRGDASFRWAVGGGCFYARHAALEETFIRSQQVMTQMKNPQKPG